MYALTLIAQLPSSHQQDRSKDLMREMPRAGLHELKVQALPEGKLLLTCSVHAEDEASAMACVVGGALDALPSLKVLQISAVSV